LPSCLRPSAAASAIPEFHATQVKRGRRNARAALDAEIESVRRAVEGTRNDQLTRSAFAVARFVTDGSLSASEYVERLVAAATDAGSVPTRPAGCWRPR
jgi:hypothetical protein